VNDRQAPGPVPPAGAVLVLDLTTDAVVHQDDRARRFVRGVTAPAPAEDWTRAADLRHADDGLPVDLCKVATAPTDGVAVTVAAPDGVAGTVRCVLTSSGPAGGGGTLAVVVLEPVDAGSLERRAVVASDLSFTIADARLPDVPLVWVNPAFTATTGYTVDDVLGRNCRLLQGPGTDRATVDRVREGIAARTTVGETLLNYRKDGTPFWNQLVLSPITDAHGDVTHVVGVQADVTARIESEQARERQLDDVRSTNRRLSTSMDITQHLTQILEVDGLLREAAATFASAFDAWALVVTYPGGRSRSDVATSEPALRDAARLLSGNAGWADRSLAAVDVLDGGSRFAQPFDITPDLVSSYASAEQRAAMEALGLGSAMTVALRARGKITGVVGVVSREPGAFGPQDAAMLEDLGQRVGLLLDNARLYAAEHEAARALQERMLPTLAQVEGLDVAVTYRPASDGEQASAAVGGDWFDVLERPDGTVALVVGDVVGHDMHAAASMGQLRSVLRTVGWDREDPAEVLGRVDHLVKVLDLADIATCTFASLGPVADDGSRPLAYCRAGHPPPLLLRPDGTVTVLDGALATPVGVPNVGGVESARVDVPAGSALVLYTDGLVESRARDQRTGTATVVAALEAAPAGLDAAGVRDLVLAAAATGRQEDDLCVLVVRT
jgi:PAS domain S-box-containing protein